MPDALEKAYGYHIYFWSNENEPLEPLHIHISKTPHPNATKYWILSDGSLLLENNKSWKNDKNGLIISENYHSSNNHMFVI